MATCNQIYTALFNVSATSIVGKLGLAKAELTLNKAAGSGRHSTSS